ncbi:GNAT family N-acetyltransferase [bacterium]|nr:GNAT family N-acetyltransferase [bacterium]
MKDITVYNNCPVYESDHFRLRLVDENDAHDLLECYSDPSAVRLMNADNCTCDFYFQTPDEMQDSIREWIGSYKQCDFIRFSIIDRHSDKAVGTIEMFDKTQDIGILRLDLRSTYEKSEHLLEIIELSTEKFYEAFGVKKILTKAIAEAAERIGALDSCGYTNIVMPRGNILWTWIDGKKVRDRKLMPYGDYYVHEKC